MSVTRSTGKRLWVSDAMASDVDTPAHLVGRLLAAWNAGDVAGIAACFAEGGDLVSTEGRRACGRLAVAALLGDEFAGPLAGSRATIDLISARPLGPDLVLLDANMAVTDLPMHVVFIARQVTGVWCFEAVRPSVPHMRKGRSDEAVD
jgi:uncharacterized protein (TIGR02246 family)